MIPQRPKLRTFCALLSCICHPYSAHSAVPRAIAPSFTPGQPLAQADTSLAQIQTPPVLGGTPNPNALAVGAHTGGALPLNTQSVLPARPNLPDDPVIPHNGFATVEEGEKAFTHLLKKAGVDENWTWDQTMRAIITDPLYKSLNTLAEKKRSWQKVTFSFRN